MDKALGQFMGSMDKEGLLDDTVIVIYGDHDARISRKNYDYMYNYDPILDKVLDEDDNGYVEFNDYDYELSKKVPLIIWSKDMDEVSVIDTPMGMIDVMPTLGNMLNIYNKYALGHDIFEIGENNIAVIVTAENGTQNKINIKVIGYAASIGILLGTFQILNTKAITIIDGTLIFPAYYGGALILSYLSSLLILKEKISNKQKLSLAVGVIAIVLMNL